MKNKGLIFHEKSGSTCTSCCCQRTCKFKKSIDDKFKEIDETIENNLYIINVAYNVEKCDYYQKKVKQNDGNNREMDRQ